MQLLEHAFGDSPSSRCLFATHSTLLTCSNAAAPLTASVVWSHRPEYCATHRQMMRMPCHLTRKMCWKSNHDAAEIILTGATLNQERAGTCAFRLKTHKIMSPSKAEDRQDTACEQTGLLSPATAGGSEALHDLRSESHREIAARARWLARGFPVKVSLRRAFVKCSRGRKAFVT
jgi:hypothetical protein